ncbi:MAG TPA: IS5 family transposase [Terriglobia bacterium]|nr:IS5 family transposase [Terriglobia bacterium]
MRQIKSWEVSDEFWARVEPLIPVPERPKGRKYKRRPGGGRKPMPARNVLSAIVHVLRKGCQWKAVPKEFGSASAIHKHFQQWHRAGFFLALWRTGLAEYDEMEGIAWDWQSIDGASVKAPLATECVGANPTDRGKKRGRKRSLLVDGRGVPLSLAVSGANVHDVKLLPATLDRVVRARPATSRKKPQRLCADAGYKGSPARREAERRNYQPHIQQRKEEAEAKRTVRGYKARRWVVERTHSWFNRYRKVLVSFEKTEESYVALLSLAAAMICWRRTIVI